MLVRDVMTMNVVSVTGNTSIADAKKIMDAHKIRRLPVVDKGKLIGVVTEHRLEAYTPSKATSLSVWEIGYLLGNTSVKDIMEKNIVTVSPEMTVEKSLALAQEKKVGALLVVENGQLVGIVTTNDFFYKVANPTLGIGMPGTRVEVMGDPDKKILQDICQATSVKGMNILTLHMIVSTETSKRDIVVHVDTDNVKEMIEELKGKGYEVNVRNR